MKRIFMLCAGLCALVTGFGQNDSTAEHKPDTIKVGGMVIIREKGNNREDGERNRNRSINISTERVGRRGPVSTNWGIFDFGFSNYTDKTDYTAAQNMGTVDAGIGKDQMKLRTWKSRNINIWFFMQRINLIERVVNFKYGVGLELNNYFFDDRTIHLGKNPLFIDQFYPSDLKKNKLAADYLTMPLMLNINFTPERRHNSYGFSGGVSIGYLYSARQKIKQDGKVNKVKGIDMDEWKLSYVGELSLGAIHLYGSYALESMFDKGLDMTPYTVGFRFSNW
jgi:Outer membrane protein beta-barrel domain